MRDEVLYWLSEARADLRHVEASMRLGDYNWACFAAQQAAEKALKALILHLLGEYPRGQDLVVLYRRVRAHLQLGVGEAALSRLSAFYTLARYPNAGLVRPSEEIASEQAEEALATRGW
ncbi:putative conserved protein related to C-terminal domain of eukaryotic chaperone, SACSIN [Pyrobaculum oguniense TE7]|uniref:Conserved protein related to C-terminal domain of eukaryotic chaperone, SACSIN n=1 Tax=Pyrobaculum oguniense (strain DSM 13380 / JCM 10595 / TE7) TaxID=698757 RepID=H6QA84_PYROT|nr:putative conserved protein related to C-terminal domain of eukaryotic chaperone, SACSIN [Pyrobaculum oguniense TE7]